MVIQARKARYESVVECFEALKEQFTPCHIILHDPLTSGFDFSEVSGADVPHHFYEGETVRFKCGARKMVEYFE